MSRLFSLTFKSHTKNQTDSDIFDGVLTSFVYDVTSKTDDVITSPKLSESVWIFFCDSLAPKWTIVAIFYEHRFSRSVFSKIPDMTSSSQIWRHKSVKSVGISLDFFSLLFNVNMTNRANFYKKWFRGTIFFTIDLLKTRG